MERHRSGHRRPRARLRLWIDLRSVQGERRQLRQSGDSFRLRHRPHRRDVPGKSERRLGRQFWHDLLLQSCRRHCLVVRHGAVPQRQFGASFSGRGDERKDLGVLAGRPSRNRSQRGALQLAIEPARMLLTPTSSTSLSGRRWTKLYDAGVPSAESVARGQAAG
jgi:hypothetical protein